MTDNEIRIAIAEACGWTWCKFSGDKLSDPSAYWYPPNEKTIPPFMEPQGMCHLRQLPDYCNDLNAMYDVEETIMFPEAYATRIQIVLHRDWGARGKNVTGFSTTDWFFAFAHATARQRAEAFLRTLGKWKEEPNG